MGDSSHSYRCAQWKRRLNSRDGVLAVEKRGVCDEDCVEIAALCRSTIRSVNAHDYPEGVIASWSATTDAADLVEKSSRCLKWVARGQDKIVGSCEYTLACEVSRIYVQKDHLRRDVCSRLLSVAGDSLNERAVSRFASSPP